MTLTLNGNAAIVTGAASGIGKATAEMMARFGAQVLYVDRNSEGVNAASEHAKAQGWVAEACTMDLTDATAPAAIFDAVKEAFGTETTILVNNAGLGNARAADETNDTDWEMWIDLNLTTVFRMSREAVSRLPSGGSIVNLSSVFGLTGFKGSASYSAAKAGIIGLTRQMAADYGERGIRVNAVAPGLIATPATEERIKENALFKHSFGYGTPMNRYGRPEDIANAIVFLSSSMAAFMTGQVLAVDGGWTATHYRSPESLSG